MDSMKAIMHKEATIQYSLILLVLYLQYFFINRSNGHDPPSGFEHLYEPILNTNKFSFTYLVTVLFVYIFNVPSTGNM